MKSIEDRFLEMKEDPVRLARFFKFTWIVAYSVLILGFVLIIGLLIKEKFF